MSLYAFALRGGSRAELLYDFPLWVLIGTGSVWLRLTTTLRLLRHPSLSCIPSSALTTWDKIRCAHSHLSAIRVKWPMNERFVNQYGFLSLVYDDLDDAELLLHRVFVLELIASLRHRGRSLLDTYARIIKPTIHPRLRFEIDVRTPSSSTRSVVYALTNRRLERHGLYRLGWSALGILEVLCRENGRDIEHEWRVAWSRTDFSLDSATRLFSLLERAMLRPSVYRVDPRTLPTLCARVSQTCAA